MALTSLRPLRSRNFALLWSAALVSNVGSWMQAVALASYVTIRTHNPLWTGLVAAAAFLPNGLLAPFGGVVADRLNRRRWLLLTTLGETAFASLLAALALSGHVTPAVAVLVALAGGCASAVGFPAYQAMLPDLVERRDLLAAVSLSSAQFNLGRVVGPALAGVVVVAGGYGAAFAANAASFGAVVVALLVIRLPDPVRADGTGWRRRMADGVAVARGEPGCRSAIVLIAIVALLGSPFIALVPAMAIVGLHARSSASGAAATSVLVTAQGMGAVAGALALPGLARRLGRRTLVVGALFALPPFLALYGVAPRLALSALALVVVGAVYIGILSGLNTVVQLRAPEAARGRVLSLYMFALGTVYPVGAVVQGELGHAAGVRVVTVAAAGALLVALALVALVRPGILAALATPEPTAGTEVAPVPRGVEPAAPASGGTPLAPAVTGEGTPP